MKQLLLLIGLVSISLSSLAQAGFYGKRQKEPLDLGSGITVSEGDTVYFGYGTIPNGDFKFIMNPANGIVGLPEMPFQKSWGGRYAIVNAIRINETKKYGKKEYVVVSAGRNAMIEMRPAIEAGEVVGVNSKRFEKGGVAAKSITSVADELLKLKQLLDAGAITQEEYNTQKKKLLD